MAQPEDSLHSKGWRQGSLFSTNLVICITGASGPIHIDHRHWVISSQDCDLAGIAVTSEELVEIRPVYEWPQKLPMSIRSRRFPIADGFCVDWRAPKVAIAARELAAFRADSVPSARHRRYFKTWLGKGYDRPAVPKAQVPLAEAVARVVTKMKARDIDVHVRDVLMVLRADDPKFVELYAVVLEDHAHDRDSVSIWINDIALKVGEDGFTVGRREAKLESEISLLLIENSYSANLSDITTRAEERAGLVEQDADG